MSLFATTKIIAVLSLGVFLLACDRADQPTRPSGGTGTSRSSETGATKTSSEGGYAGSEQSMPIPQVIKDIGQGTMTYAYDHRKNLFVADVQNATDQNQKIPAHQKNNRILRIASYNVHFWTDPNATKNSIRPILDTIRAINADVLSLQEVNWVRNVSGTNSLSSVVTNMSIGDLQAEFAQMGYLTNDAAFFQAAEHRGSPFGNLILSKYPAVTDGAGRRAYSTGLVHGETRGLARLTILLPNGMRLLIVSTHLEVENLPNGTLASAARKIQLAEIVTYLNDPMRASEKNVVVAGDMNQIRPLEMSYLVNNQKASVLFALKQRDPVVWDVLYTITTPGFVDSFTKKGWQTPKFTTWNGSTIDYIFVKNSFEMKVVGAYTYFSAASDHVPLIMDVEMSADK